MGREAGREGGGGGMRVGPVRFWCLEEKDYSSWESQRIFSPQPKLITTEESGHVSFCTGPKSMRTAPDRSINLRNVKRELHVDLCYGNHHYEESSLPGCRSHVGARTPQITLEKARAKPLIYV